MTDRISKEDVAHVADLARLTLTDEELDAFTGQLADVLDHAADLEALDLADVEPMTHPLPIRNVLRPDVVGETSDRAEVLACPIPDMGLPDGGPDEMREILDAVDLALDAGRNVYVHCWGGSGRTGTVVGCWLRRHGLAEPEEVLEVLQDLRTSGDRNGGHKDTPQTPDQRWMVESWEEG